MGLGSLASAKISARYARKLRRMWIENPTPLGILPKFVRVELPKLAVIVGPNGVGKSQLLRGIFNGDIGTEVSPFTGTARMQSPASRPNIALLTNFDPDPPGITASRESDYNELMKREFTTDEAYSLVQRAVKQQEIERDRINELVRAETGKNVTENGLNWDSFVGYASNLGLLGQPSAEFRWANRFRGETIDAGTRIGKILAGLIGKPNDMPLLQRLATPAHLLAWDSKQMAAIMNWPAEGLFSPNLISIFLQYRERRWQNQMRRQADIDEGTKTGLTPEKFVEIFGRPPWDLVSEALEQFQLPYQVIPISYDARKPVTFEMTRRGSDQPISYQALSSGEKILLKMVLATFQTNYERINIIQPQLILLDELDASLHPQNVRRWLTAVKDGYVDALGIPCILTTHSPTTVALADEGAIFEMTADDATPHPISKQKAIDRLTAGLPMLSIDYSARRQVFTESTIDVAHYAMIHDIVRPELELPKTLSFVGSSTNGGCTIVYQMVNHMEANGNRAVFGIVDWDLKNSPTSRVKVLAYGTHYAKENVLLDPVLIGALLLKSHDLPFDPPIYFSDLRAPPSGTLQRISDEVVNRIKWPAAATKELGTNYYWGGDEVAVRIAFQRFNGHDLEKMIKAVFPMLEKRYQAEGALGTAIIERVLRELPNLMPKPLVELMQRLANDEP
ncbi:ATP-binding protein [Sphingomonas sp. TX0522]|nr:ATP-binding protein [Sphingomonas sp. TX0522]